MYSAALVLGLLAGTVLSSPAHHGHGHKYRARQNEAEVIDIVDVYTTVTLDGPAPSQAPKVHNRPEEKIKWPGAYHAASASVTSAPASSSPAAAPVQEKVKQPVANPPAPSPVSPPASSSAPPPAAPVSSSPPAQSSTAASSSGNDYLDVHNQYRSAHGAAQMTWDSTLASTAQSEVNGCPNDDVQSGSNWFGSSGSASVASALAAWYGEMAAYASETNNYASNPPSSGGADTGHFSQMIWNGSTSLGCAMSSSCSGSWATQVTCLYSPAGNMVFNGVPQYTENVFPLGGKS